MEGKIFAAGGWLGRTMEVFSRALDLRAEKHAVIAANVANMDVPGYVPKELTFERELQQALGQGGGLQPVRTNPHHLPAAGDSLAAVQGKLEDRRDYALGNGSYQLDLDNEMSRLVQNDLKYEVTAQLLAKKLTLLRLAIVEGGK
ncbi:MAG: flagellar basal body rod protein FlgB [Deltaproteobacteria bacterium]|nr:flagellar basal body rod protein FlgB [Deltaproteobacteria bacterium]MBW2069737.1 flagellar basal body rod protein FlgB [Deltaproteobacteria bacterium]